MNPATSLDLWRPQTSAGKGILGSCVQFGATAEDTTLFFVDSAGDFAQSAAQAREKAATDVAVKQYAGTGDLVLRYLKVEDASNIAQGEAVTFEGTPGWVQGAVAGDVLTAVAMQNVDDQEFAWFAVGGAVKALCDAAQAPGNLLTTDAAGDLTTTGATISNAVAVALETTLAAGLCIVELL